MTNSDDIAQSTCIDHKSDDGSNSPSDTTSDTFSPRLNTRTNQHGATKPHRYLEMEANLSPNKGKEMMNHAAAVATTPQSQPIPNPTM